MDCLNPLRSLGIKFDLLPQPLNMNIYCSGGWSTVISPYLPKQFFVAQGFATMLNEITQQLKLARRKKELLAVLPNFGLPWRQTKGNQV
jgi:hypothetical protein